MVLQYIVMESQENQQGVISMTQRYHRTGFIAFGMRGQSLLKTMIYNLGEYAFPGAICDKSPNVIPPPDLSYRAAEALRFTDYHDVLKMKEIDSVIISTYEDTHVQISKESIEAGKAVYCEKPVVPTLKQAEELYRYVTSRPCQFMIGLNLPNYPVPLKLKELLNEQIIGDLIMVRSATDVGQVFARNHLINKFSCKRGNFITAKLTHDTDLLQYLCGSYAERVWGRTKNYMWRRHGEPAMTDDTAVMSGELHNGVLFTQSLTSCGSSYGRKMHFFGTKGELQADIHGTEILLKRCNGTEQVIQAPVSNSSDHNGADMETLKKFFDYMDSDIMKPSEPERILSSVMIPMAAS